MFRTKFVGEMKKKKHFVLKNFFSTRAVYEIMLKNFVELNRSHITTGAYALHAGYLSLQHTQYVIFLTSPFTTMFHQRAPT